MEQLEELSKDEVERKQLELENLEEEEESEDTLVELPEEPKPIAESPRRLSGVKSKMEFTTSKENISQPAATPPKPAPVAAAQASESSRRQSGAAKYKAELAAAKESPAPSPANTPPPASQNSVPFPSGPSGTGSNRGSTASGAAARLSTAQKSPEPADSQPHRLSFKKPVGDPKAEGDRGSEALAARTNLKQVGRTSSMPPKADPRSLSASDDATPEFLKIKGGLRKTVYEEEQQAQPAAKLRDQPKSQQLRPRSRSVGDLDKVKDDEKVAESKKKEKGFFSSLFDKFKKKPKADAAVTTKSESSGSTSSKSDKPEKPEKPDHPPKAEASTSSAGSKRESTS